MPLRSDVRVHALEGRIALRSPDGSVQTITTTDPAGLAQRLRNGTAPAEERAALEKRGLSGATDLVGGARPNLLPVRSGVIHVDGDGEAAQAARAALARLGSPAARPGAVRDAKQDLVLLALDAWDLARIEAANASAQVSGQPWLAACPTEARRITVGPLIVPGETACYSCWLARRTANSWQPDAFADLVAQSRDADAITTLPQPWTDIAAQLAAWEAVRFQRGLVPSTLGAVVSWSGDDLVGTRDAVAKVPRCAACSRHNRVPPVEPWMPLPEASPSKDS